MQIITKILSSLLIVLTVIILVSSIIYLAPVDPARLTFGQRADESSIELKKKELHLDQPLWKQMCYYINDISFISFGNKGDYAQKGVKSVSVLPLGDQKLLLKQPYFRESYQSGASVWDMFKEAVPKTAILATSSMVIAIILGILFGIISALNRDKFIDQFIIALSTVGISVPSYVSAIILALIFGYTLGDYTGLNIQGSIFDLDDMGNDIVVWKNLLLPSIALGIRPLSIITQLMRSSLLDVLSMDYIRTAKAKGLAFSQIIKKHALKNAMNPVVTAISGWFASLLAGTFFVEHVFNFKGLGSMTVNALTNYDIPVILASVIFISIVFILTNIFVDYSYKWLDPRVK